MTNRLDIYNRVYDILKRDCTSFKFVTKRLNNQNVNALPLLYISVVSSNFITLDNSVQAEQIEMDCYIIAQLNSNSKLSESEYLMTLTQEVEEALAKPNNWSENHLGFRGFVHNVQISQIQYYDDASAGQGTISASLSLVVTSSVTGYEKDFVSQDSY